MARLPVYHSQGNISITQPIAPIENPMWGEVKKIAQLGQDLAVKWQNVQNETENLDGKNKLETALDSILQEAKDYSGYSGPKEIQAKQDELLKQNQKVLDEVVSGFTNQRNANNFRQKYQISTMRNQEFIKAAFRQKSIDLNNANLTIDYDKNKRGFIESGDAVFKENYKTDLDHSFNAGLISAEKCSAMTLKMNDWDFDYAQSEAIKHPNETLADLGRFGLNAKDTQRVKETAESILKKQKEQIKKGKTEKEAMQISMTQQINKQMFEDQWKADKGKIQKDMNSIFDFRNSIQEKFIANELSEKDYAKLQADTIAPLLEKVKSHSAGNPVWWNTSFDETVIGVDKKIDLDNVNDEIRAYVYDLIYSSLKERNINPDTRFGRDDKAISEIVEKVSTEYLQNNEPNLLGVEANKVLLGTKMFDYKLDGGGKEIKPKKYQLMQDKNGNKYKVYPDKDGKYTDNSIMERVS